MLTTIGLMALMFTAGLVLEPFIARLVKKRAHARHNRKVGNAIRLLESEGFTVKWTPKDVSGWGEVTTQIREDGSWV